MDRLQLKQDAVIVSLRKTLHAHAELSGMEEKTSAIMQNFFEQYPPDRLLSR